MRKPILLLSFLVLIAVGQLRAQVFSNTTSVPIPSGGTELRIPVTVMGLPTVLNSSFGLGALCFDITHQADVNLRIQLESPDGHRITLIDQKGSNGDNFTGTCLMENGVNGWVMTGTAPFTGSYFPMQSLNLLNNGQDPNGVWYFCVTDLFLPADTGSFHYVNLTFMNNPPADPTGTSGPCNEQNAGACQCPTPGSTDCDLLPDVTASQLSMQQDHHEYNGHITVGVGTPNIGWGPLEIHGIQSCYCDTVQVSCSTSFCPSGEPPKQLVNQRIYHKTGNNMTYFDRPAGTMSYHPSHGHIHVDNWLYYTLRTWSPDPDPSNWPIVGTGTKMSFCLINLSDCDSWYGYCVDSTGRVLTRADFPNADFGNVSGCTNDQGIYVGNIDEYSSGMNGAGIVIPNACNDTYYIVAITNPLNLFLESNERNNWAVLPITLNMQTNANLLPSGFTYTLNGLSINSESNASGADTCIWVWGDGTRDTVLANSVAHHSYTAPGSFVLFHYAINQCGPTVSADTIQVLSTGLGSPVELAETGLFPNPSKDQTFLIYSLASSSQPVIEVFDALGNRLKQIQPGTQFPGKYRVPMSSASENWTAGTYFIRIRTANSEKTLRWIVF